MKLRLLRIIVSVIAFGVLTGSVASVGGVLWHRFASWLAEIQFLQAAFAFSISTILLWLLITLVFGRIYCSSVCPLGTLQDIVARLPRLGAAAARHAYHYSRPLSRWRITMLAVAMAAILLSISSVISILDPYSLYHELSEWAVTPLKFAAASVTGIVAAMIVMGTVLVLAFRNGRTYCNTICPVGTTLGFISKYSLFHIDINTDLCTQCRRCEEVCKASCIDLYDHVVDGSRCVNCFDCLQVCPDEAIAYTYRRHQLADPMMRRVKNPLAGSAAGFSDIRRIDISSPKTPSDTNETISRPSRQDNA